MNRELIVVQRLVDALDDSRSLYDKGADKVAHPHLRDLLERIAGTHRLIADDLAGQIVETGGGVARHGSRSGPLRTFLAEKSAQISFDIEMVYASHAVKREAGILRGFRAAVASIRDAGLCNRLRMHCRELERASMEISCLRTTMQLRTNPRTTRALVGVHESKMTNQMKHLLCKTVLSLSVLASASAFAADGDVTGNVYLRAGPDPGYPSVAMLDAGTPVAIEGCVNGWSWCDVDAGGNRGWVEGNFLQDDYRGQRVLVPQYGVQIGIPIISFVFASYWQDHYRDQSWYSQRQRWSQVQPRYQTVVVQHNVYENLRASTHGNSRAESNRTTVATAPARSGHEMKPSRTATPQRSVATNGGPNASHAIRSLPTAHNAAPPRSQAPVSRSATQRQATQPRAMVAQHQTASAAAQQKKQPQKSKSDKHKHPYSSGQH